MMSQLPVSESKLLIEAQYFPNLEYFLNILEHDIVYIEAWETWQKQSYRNRCHILTANKVHALTLPVINPGREVLIREVKIDYSQKWVNVHWGAIRSAYGKAPFFEYYSDLFHSIYVKRHTFLFDFNLEVLTLCLKLLGLSKKVEYTTFFNKSPDLEIADFRSVIHPKRDNNQYRITWISYPQLFGRNFVPNLSILDLLFCEGKNAKEILSRSKKERI